MTNQQGMDSDKGPTQQNNRETNLKAEPSQGGTPTKSDSPPLRESRATSPKVWADLQENLTHALSTWEHLSIESEHKLSPEEEQMQEVKRLLHELKDKLREFSK